MANVSPRSIHVTGGMIAERFHDEAFRNARLHRLGDTGAGAATTSPHAGGDHDTEADVANAFHYSFIVASCGRKSVDIVTPSNP